MANEYKAVWTEPSYGECWMSKSDYLRFTNIIGNEEQRYTTRKNLLVNYSAQYPFKGDGVLYDFTYDEYLERLPTTIKINGPMKVEKESRSQIFNDVSVNSEWKESMVELIPGLKTELGMFNIYQSKMSISRPPDEGVKNNSGNRLKAVSVMVTPSVSVDIETINSEVRDAKNRSESIILKTVDTVIEKAKAGYDAGYEKLVDTITAINEAATALSRTLNQIRSEQERIFQSALARGREIANTFNAAINESLDFLVQSASEALGFATEALGDAFGGLAETITSPVGFSVISLSIAGTGSVTGDAVASTRRCLYPDGVTKGGCPPVPGYGTYDVGRFKGYNVVCYKPRDLSDTSSIDRARSDAIAFAEEVNGFVWDDCEEARFVVFFSLND